MITYRAYTDIQLLDERKKTLEYIDSLNIELLSFGFGTMVIDDLRKIEKELHHWECHLKDAEKELLKRGLLDNI
jgi:hypothetical protein